MNLKVLGCHGGETPKHRTSSFLLNETLAIDAGALCSALSLEEQRQVSTILVSHPHMDHIRDLGTMADNRFQQGGPGLKIVGIPATIEALRRHYFNDTLWPDFTRIKIDGAPLVTFETIEPDKAADIEGHCVTPVLVDHTVDTSAFVIEADDGAIVYGGDTGPTNRLWEHINATKSLHAVMMEVSFPNAEQELATASCHHTPQSLDKDLGKLKHPRELPILLYHVKPVFESAVLKELAALSERNLVVLQLEDELIF